MRRATVVRLTRSSAAAAEKVGELIAVHVIPRPHPNIKDVFPIKVVEDDSKK